jgi:hypothetical protein
MRTRRRTVAERRPQTRAWSRTSILGAEVVKEVDELVTIGVDGCLAAFDVLVDLAFHALPSIGPEPRLLRRNREPWPKLDHSVVSLDDLDVRARLVEAITAPKLRWKGEETP